VEVGDDVGELRPGRAALERVQIRSVGLERDGDELRAGLVQQQQRAVVRGLLDDHPVARSDEVAKQQGRRLHRAVRDHHPVGLDPMQLGDPLAQLRVPHAGPVGQGALPVALERAGGRLPHRLGGQDVGARRAAGEADRLRCHRRAV
jgi:hypothetical protein